MKPIQIMVKLSQFDQDDNPIESTIQEIWIGWDTELIPEEVVEGVKFRAELVPDGEPYFLEDTTFSGKEYGQGKPFPVDLMAGYVDDNLIGRLDPSQYIKELDAIFYESSGQS